MRRFSFAIFILFLSGCQSSQVLTFEPTTLATIGPVAIEVTSFAGDVTIIADESQQSTTVHVEQRDDGYQGENLTPRFQWHSRIEPSDLGQMVIVEATTQDDALHTLHADIVITAPSVQGIKVQTTRGDVSAYGISGSVHIQTNDGDVRIVTPLVMNEEVFIENRRGDITMRIRGESSGTIDATAMNGKASLNVRHGEVVILPGSTGDHVMARFNLGTNQYVMRTVDGDIRISVVEDPIGDEPWFDFEWFSW